EIEDPCFQLEWADTFRAGREAIQRGDHDVCLVDYQLGDGDGVELVRQAVAEGCQAPLILLTGLRSREVDRAAMEAGASDYLVKGTITADSLERALRYAMEHKRVLRKLQAAHEQVRHLEGILPICMYCKKIRQDEHLWQRLETYLAEHTQARCSHGICPDCWEEVIVPQLRELGHEDVASDAGN
ncbi:MAG: diguanylate cyclase, partial [Armatimonadetes bacterium]|nr:diguanylate cyclase [Armatimonadota bacterium]